jgi:hypothetical protein
MKWLIYSTLLVSLLACKGNENKKQAGDGDTTKVHSGKTEYTCPMHPEIISDTAAQCPRCGMDLEAKG